MELFSWQRRILGFAKFLILLISFGFFSLHSNADDDPARIIISDHPDVEVALRVKAIDEAQKSIKIVTFNFDGNSRYGKSIFEALKRAANRGVEIKIMFNSLSTMTLGGSYKADIRDLESQPCVGVNCGNITQRLRAGFAPDDFLHEKFLIIDSGTDQAKIFSGGLNYDKYSAEFFDDGFLILPAKDGKNDRLHERINTFFDETWETVNRDAPKAKTKSAAEPIPTETQQATLDRLLDTPEKKAAFEELKNKPLGEQAIDVNKVTFVPSDLFLQLQTGGTFQRYISRVGVYDHIGLKIKSLLKKATFAQMTSYLFAPRGAIREGLIEMLESGGKLDFFTNGTEAHSAFFQSMPAYYSYGKLNEFKNEIGPEAEERITLRFLEDKTPTGEPTSFKFLHNKVILIEHEDKVFSIVGSDNFTDTFKRNQETALVIEEPKGNSPFYDSMSIRLNIHRNEFHIYDWDEIKRRFQSRPLKAICGILFGAVKYTY